MKNTIFGALAAGALLVGGIAGTSQSALADDDDNGKRAYRVTITNAMAGQPLAPGLIVTHRKSFTLFQLNGEASHGLAVMAETGNPGGLAEEVLATSGVKTAEVVEGNGEMPPLTLPRESSYLEFSTRARFASVAGMLAATNDAFYAVRGVRLPRRGNVTVRAVAYDAGSEKNSELKTDIPAFGNGEFSDEEGEGFIHIHNGVHGVAGGDGLNPAAHDWRNPVVQITIERIRKHDDDDD